MDFTLAEGAQLTAQLAMGISLAACAGLRAFLPLLIVGVAGRMDLVPLSSSFEWLSGWPAITVFSVAVVAELAGDKFPVVDNFLDVVQGFAKPVAGTILVAGMVTDLGGLQTAVLSIVTGGAVAGGVHLTKSSLRAASTVTTAGFGNPLLSFAEDGVSLAGSFLALIAPIVAFVMMLVFFVVGILLLRKIRLPRAAT